MEKFGLTELIAHSIVIEYDLKNNKTMTFDQYRSIMQQLYYVNKYILFKRIEAFQSCTNGSDLGIIKVVDLYLNYYKIMSIFEIPPTVYVDKFTIDNIAKYDYHKFGYMNFLEFNCFINDLLHGKI